jgi:hypothetical protein
VWGARYLPENTVISKLINTRISVIQHLYRNYDFSGSDDFVGVYDE